MDKELKEAEKQFLETLDPIDGTKYQNSLLRSGLKPREAVSHLINVLGLEIKKIILAELPKCKFEAGLGIVQDAQYSIFDDYKGHFVDAPGFWLNYTDHHGKMIILREDGIFTYDRTYASHIMFNGKLVRTIHNFAYKDRVLNLLDSGALLSSKSEDMSLYVTYASFVLDKIQRNSK